MSDSNRNFPDEFMPNPDERGLLILVKMDNLFCYLGKDNRGISTEEELDFNSCYKHEDFDSLCFYENDHNGIIEKINSLKEDYTYVRLLDVVRDDGMFVIDYDLTDKYIGRGLI